MLERILKEYKLNGQKLSITPFGSGLINHTWLIADGSNTYILQRVNDKVFKRPEDISFNIHAIGNYLADKHPGYLFVKPLETIDRQELVHVENEGYFRLFPFVPGSHTVDLVSDPSQAFEAARQFGKFTRLLSGFDASQLKTTIPDFHNLSLRYRQFEDALKHGNRERIQEAQDAIAIIKKNRGILTVSENIAHDANFRVRVTHHDTKISNVLFDADNKGLCVIDLDTVMPGYFISDVGDMMRTYLSPVSEEEKDLSTIEIRQDYFHAIREGYLSEMNDELSPTEKEYFVYAGKFMIYMQALRFLTDHLNDDVYYGAKYDGHNFMRANNQLRLLQCLSERFPSNESLHGFVFS